LCTKSPGKISIWNRVGGDARGRQNPHHDADAEEACTVDDFVAEKKARRPAEPLTIEVEY
jgi:hypothetical protein